jgi:hypothetical protein
MQLGSIWAHAFYAVCPCIAAMAMQRYHAKVHCILIESQRSVAVRTIGFEINGKSSLCIRLSRARDATRFKTFIGAAVSSNVLRLQKY